MGNNKLGYFFIFIGLLLLLNNLGLLSGHAFLLILGLGFIAIYLLIGGKKRYGNVGFLIPGTILISIWISIILTESIDLGSLDGPHFLFLMGLSFISIFLLHTLSFRDKSHGDRFWPIYPALGLILIGGIGYLSEIWDSEAPITINRLWNYIWVIVFLGIGLKLILGKKKSSPKNNDDEDKI